MSEDSRIVYGCRLTELRKDNVMIVKVQFVKSKSRKNTLKSKHKAQDLC